MHQTCRERFLDVLAREEAAAVVAAGTPSVRSHDTEFPFRPSSDFYWLTGFDEPEAVLVLVPHGEARSVLFLRDSDREAEIWTGRRLGVAAAPETLGVDAAHPIGELWERLPELLGGARRIVHPLGEDEARDRRMLEVQARLKRKARLGAVPALEWVDPALWLHELRLRKRPEELARMRRALELTVEGHARAMAAAEPGRHEHELDALLSYVFRRGGATGNAYANIVAGGANACILHYTRNDRPLADGDLLLIDAGAEWSYYASDVTRTFPVNGRFTPEQRALYEVVLDAQRGAIEATRPGATLVGVHDLAVRRLVEGLHGLGLLSEPVDEATETGSYRRFYMHKTGHWLGLDVHDCGAYWVDGRPRPLEPGMVSTVEPGIYVAPDDETVDARWRGIGIRIEDDVLVTEDGQEVLSAALPTGIDEIEALCRKEALVPTG